MTENPHRPLLSLSVGVTGHRFNKMAATERKRIREQLHAVLAAIDAACAARPGNVSRNTWIAEAVEEKLAREGNAAKPTERRAHG